MRAYGLDEQIRDFIWWRNFQVGNLNDESARYHAAAFITRVHMEMQAEVAIGRPIDLPASDQSRSYIAIPRQRGVYGVYVQADKRQMFNFMVMMNGVKEEAELRREKPVKFDNVFQRARAVLPYDKK